ncbi:sugar transferase [Candidatus Gracilibacteria bacterium]|nr:sugar transferase [Candidatus Gracilibacteria bacterium]
MKRVEIFFGAIRLPIDFFLVFMALLYAYYLRLHADAVFPQFFLKQADFASFPPLETYRILSLYGAGLFVAIVALGRGYALKSTSSISHEIKIVIVAALIWLMSVITYYFFLREFLFSRLVLFFALGLALSFVLAGRLAVRFLQTMLILQGIGVRRIILVGNGSVADQLDHFIGLRPRLKVIARVQTFEKLEETLKHFRNTDEVIQTDTERINAEDIIELCREYHVQYNFVPTVFEVRRSNIHMQEINGIPLITLQPTRLDGWGKVIKRLFDLVVSFLGLIILSPVFLIIAIAIKLDSRGSVFFRRLDDGTPALRIGEREKQFCCIKFRTMRSGTHAMRYNELADKNIRKGGPLVKIANDPRVTRVGKFLRQTSLDELPQLWNVLIGEMSLVGPRPHLPEEVARYQRHHKFVLAIKPGITGMAQISGRSDLPFEEEVRLDTYYIENWSLWLDIKILFKTLGVLVKPYRE